MLVKFTSMKSFAKAPSSLSPLSERPQLALHDSGEWRYAGTPIAAVGARDVTLAEAAHPRIVSRSGDEPEAVLLSLTEIEADERLLWAVKKGTRLNGEDDPLYKIPWAVWQEYAAEPVDAYLPEWDGAGLDRSLALAEREYRFAKQAMDDAGVRRQYLVILASRLGRSRRIVGETLGLSPARIQQLSEAPPDEVVAGVEEFLGSAIRVAALLGSGACPREELPRPRDLGGDEFEEIITSMIAVGLVEKTAEGLRLTEDGCILLGKMGAKRKPVKSDSDRERAGDATR